MGHDYKDLHPDYSEEDREEKSRRSEKERQEEIADRVRARIKELPEGEQKKPFISLAVYADEIAYKPGDCDLNKIYSPENRPKI